MLFRHIKSHVAVDSPFYHRLESIMEIHCFHHTSSKVYHILYVSVCADLICVVPFFMLSYSFSHHHMILQMKLLPANIVIYFGAFHCLEKISKEYDTYHRMIQFCEHTYQTWLAVLGARQKQRPQINYRY